VLEMTGQLNQNKDPKDIGYTLDTLYLIWPERDNIVFRCPVELHHSIIDCHGELV